MNKIRKSNQILQAMPTLEGAGVHLKRVFGYTEVPTFDPFLLLDDFHSDNPEHYIKGFPWHPHRGIETVTYMIEGRVEHGDSMGNKGIIEGGEMQWMTAGCGIIHQEMPQGDSGMLWGLQLWVNLPSSYKMMNPRYRDVKASDIPEYKAQNGVKVKVISGKLNGHIGPVKDIICDPEYLDVSVPAGKKFEHHVAKGHTVFAYVLEGAGYFDPDKKKAVPRENLVHFSDGEHVAIEASKDPLRFLLISGKPINEPVAWYGPIVMNTEDELRQAFEEYQKGTFIKD